MLQPKDIGLLDKKTTPICICCLQETHFRLKDTQIKSKGMEKDISGKWKGKKGGVAVHISDKIDFENKAIVRDKEGHYIMIKGTIQ